MGSLIRRGMDQLLEEPLRSMDDLLRGFFVRPVDIEGRPRVDIDVREDEKSYTLHANMPGMKKEDIAVEIDGNLVRITAESKMEREEREGEEVIHSERYIGRLMRTVRLDGEVDEDLAKAHYQDGVLELTLPKRLQPAARRQLTVE